MFNFILFSIWRTQVRLGEYDTSTTDDGPTVDIDVIRVEKHERFNSTWLMNDIAIVFLKDDVEFTPTIKPVCLNLDPPNSERDLVGKIHSYSSKNRILNRHFWLTNKYVTGLNPFVIGWGRMYAAVPASYPEILQQLQIFIHKNQVCAEAFDRKLLYATPEQFDESIICAGDLRGGK